MHTYAHMHCSELNEFVIQLDEEVDAMQAIILSLQQQIKEKETRDAGAKSASNHGNSSSSSGSKDRTGSRHNGPIETNHPTSSSKASARSCDS